MKFDLRDLIEVETHYKFNKINMEKIKSVLNWFLFSSVNAKSLSLTIKGLVPFLLLLGISSEMAEQTTTAAVEVVAQGATVIAGLVTLWGAVRKLAVLLKSLIK